MAFLVFIAVLAVVVVFVSRPLVRPGAGRQHAEAAGANDVADLEAAREAKYREIREAELDHRTGKLSLADYEALDRSLRAEAVEILHDLDRARAQAHALHAGPVTDR